LDLLVLAAAATATAFATGLGVLPVAALGTRVEVLTPALLGFTAGVMACASVVGLILPALDEGSGAQVALGGAVGVGFLFAARWLIARRDQGLQRRTALLVFIVLFVHSLPEGFAIGTAYASDTAGLSLFVLIAIGLQNIPEGTSVAVPMAAVGSSGSRQFWAAVGTSVPQPVGAVVAYLLVQQIESLLPVSFAFAAGAMLALVATELVPASFRSDTWIGAAAAALAGVALMLGLSAGLGV